MGEIKRMSGQIRVGLCCKFFRAPIRFKVTTAAAVRKLPPDERRRYLSELALANARALAQAIEYCANHGIGSFRILSPILPLRTHPEFGYDVLDLPRSVEIVDEFRRCGDLARRRNIRTGFHPDQFIVLNSPNEETVRRAIADLDAQAEIAE